MGGPEPTSDGPPEVVPLEQGACPICELEFDEQSLFRAHLAEAHDLHDDDGTESGFGIAVIQPEASPVPSTVPRDHEPQQRRKEAPEMGRPLGLVALVVSLVGLLAGVIIYTGAQDDPASDEAADAPVPTTAAAGDTPRGSDSPTGSSAEAGSATTGTAVKSATATTVGTAAAAPTVGTTPGGAPAPAPSPTPTTLAPATSTTAPAATIDLPTTSDARITSCARDRDLWQVTYTWRFAGGSGWKPLSSYTSLGGGRYQHVVAVPRRDDTAITAVAVTDANGARHSVPLRPALSSASC